MLNVPMESDKNILEKKQNVKTTCSHIGYLVKLISHVIIHICYFIRLLLYILTLTGHIQRSFIKRVFITNAVQDYV